ncbi:MAG: hypothetical protein DRP08_02530 [Candidatus Aenigmatarchaeota archaeon]|nr:MAG: hypothetical protein DRP08_02530 [Candidatus Aenigmarchaeota archaeon]
MQDYNLNFYSKLNEDFWYIKSRQELIYKFIKKFKDEKNLKILDAGCGMGFNFNALKPFGDVYGIDINKRALKECRKFDYKKLELNDICNLDYTDFFDIIISIELLEHVEDDEYLLKKFYTALKKDGVLILTVPAFKFLWGKDDELSRHYRRYTKKGLNRILKENNFSIVYLSYRYFFIFFPSLLIFILQRFYKEKNSLEFSTSPLLDKFLRRIMNIENKLIERGFTFPFGVGLVCVAKK